MDAELSSSTKTDNDILPPTETRELYRPEIDTSGVDERKLIRKIDIRVIPCLAVLYLLKYELSLMVNFVI
jgi:hypothetical protein